MEVTNWVEGKLCQQLHLSFEKSLVVQWLLLLPHLTSSELVFLEIE